MKDRSNDKVLSHANNYYRGYVHSTCITECPFTPVTPKGTTHLGLLVPLLLYQWAKDIKAQLTSTLGVKTQQWQKMKSNVENAKLDKQTSVASTLGVFVCCMAFNSISRM